jgi:hypothetical protein
MIHASIMVAVTLVMSSVAHFPQSADKRTDRSRISLTQAIEIKLVRAEEYHAGELASERVSEGSLGGKISERQRVTLVDVTDGQKVVRRIVTAERSTTHESIDDGKESRGEVSGKSPLVGRTFVFIPDRLGSFTLDPDLKTAETEAVVYRADVFPLLQKAAKLPQNATERDFGILKTLLAPSGLRRMEGAPPDGGVLPALLRCVHTGQGIESVFVNNVSEVRSGLRTRQEFLLSAKYSGEAKTPRDNDTKDRLEERAELILEGTCEVEDTGDYAIVLEGKVVVIVDHTQELVSSFADSVQLRVVSRWEGKLSFRLQFLHEE